MAASEPPAPPLSGPMTPLQWGVIALCFLLNMLDGMDVLLMSYTAPLIMLEWSVDTARFGLVFSAALTGMALGAILLAPLADRYGRKRMVLASTLLIAVGMLITASTQSLWPLAGWRFITGLGVGSMLATLTAVAAEFSPARQRNLLVGLVLSGYPVGATLTGLLAAPLLETLGWPWLFLGGGCLSLLALPLIAWILPESRGFLLARQPSGALEQLNRLHVRLRLAPLDTLPPAASTSASIGPKRLFQGAQGRNTPWLWSSFFLSFLTLYFLLSWVPKIAVSAGLPLSQAVYAGALFNLGAFFGILVLGLGSQRLGLKRLIAGFFTLTVMGMLLLGGLSLPLPLLLLNVFLLGFFMQGGFVGLYAAAAQIYSPDSRSTGVGWAIGAGRTGAILGPWLGGHILALAWPLLATFAVFAIPCLLAVFTTLRLRAAPLDRPLS